MGSHRLLLFSTLACSILCATYFAHGQIQTPASQASSPNGSPIEANFSSPRSPEDTPSTVRAEELFRSGEFAEAVAQYQKLIQEGLNVGAAYAGLTRVYLKTKKVDDAYDAARKAVKLAPTLSDAHTALGDVYFRMGNLFDAAKEFLVAFDSKTPTARAYFGMFRINAAAFDEKTALAALTRAYELNPKDPDIASAWMAYRPLPDRIASLKPYLASDDKYYDRTERAEMKESLAVLEDMEAHPERTCSLTSQVKSTALLLRPAVPNWPGPLQPPSPDSADITAVGLDVEINDHSARLILDTSSGNGVSLSNAIAQKSHVQEIARRDIGGLGVQNRAEGYTGFVKSIRIGKLEFSNCYVTVAEEVSSDSSFKVYEGFISTGIFSPFIVDIDIPDSKIALNELPSIPAPPPEKPIEAMHVSAPYVDRYVATEMSDWTHVFRVRGSLLMETKVNGSNPKLFELALLAGRDYLNLALAKQVATVHEMPSPREALDTGGFLPDTFLTGPIRFEMGGRRFDQPDDVAYDFASRSDALGVEVSGYLGVEFLRNLEFKIDYRDGLVDFGGNKKLKH
jgi:tetratricopeptide (TPR) repeat protein